jgi:hypothetical protein
MLLGPGLPDVLSRNLDKLNLEVSFSREADLFEPVAGGGGGNCESDTTLVALWGATMDPGLLWKKPDVGRDTGDGV